MVGQKVRRCGRGATHEEGATLGDQLAKVHVTQSAVLHAAAPTLDTRTSPSPRPHPLPLSPATLLRRRPIQTLDSSAMASNESARKEKGTGWPCTHGAEGSS